MRLSHRLKGQAAQEAPEYGDRQQQWQQPAAGEKQNAERRHRRRIRRDAKDLGRGPAASLQRRQQRLTGKCETEDEISCPAGRPAPVEGETIAQRHDEEQYAFNGESWREIGGGPVDCRVAIPQEGPADEDP